MFIVSQDRDMVVNVDNISNIYLDNDVRINADTPTGHEIMLGMYLGRRGMAADVLKELVKILERENEEVQKQVFYMPEG